MPSGLPLTETSARFLTSPRSSHSRAPDLNQLVGTSTVLVYVAVPPKYFTPSSLFSVHDVSLSRVILGGAPRSGWKATSQEPSTVATGCSARAGSVRDGAEAERR